MILQARKKGGDKVDARNLIDTRIVFSEGEQLAKGEFSAVHSIEVVSGVPVTHGGGAPEGTFLHYKSYETDVDSDGDIDYSDTAIHTTMKVPGTSEVVVVAEVTIEADLVAMQAEWVVWNEGSEAKVKELGELHGPDEAAKDLEHAEWVAANPAPVYTPVTLKSGVLSLEWDADLDSEWV